MFYKLYCRIVLLNYHTLPRCLILLFFQEMPSFSYAEVSGHSCTLICALFFRGRKVPRWRLTGSGMAQLLLNSLLGEALFSGCPCCVWSWGILVLLSTMTGESASAIPNSPSGSNCRSCKVCTASMFTLPGTDGNSILAVMMRLGATGVLWL